ncbi:guanine nucleotide exchange factor synembryn [Drechmeria coniospora]|uniref:Guanine nucleotide exchange factor synembryn n=1 Tax=Drechmeria coniospora TaxID=98403 RepID=A0A151GFM6_DRECN|nr:guanine nucleotide exchange factor synembryn [Drechmeria coniospora]KYK55899.1 guanine nucleotide exchange factor synembryn [Drechmeria coniospora]
MTTVVAGLATGPVKLKAVTDLVDKLTDDLERATLLPQACSERNNALEDLKIYSRDPRDADPIFTKNQGISMLLRHAFHSPCTGTVQAALRVLANAMLLKPETRQMFVDERFPPKASSELATDNWDNEFLISRILFLSTYGTDINLLELIDNYQLADHIVQNLKRHVEALSGRAKTKAEPMEEMALEETLKLMFNVTHFCKAKVSSFTPGVAHAVALLWKQDIMSDRPLDPPFGPLVNALLNLDLEADESLATLYPNSDATRVSARLIELAGKSMVAYNDSELETTVTPLISLTGKIYENAPETVRQHLRESLLPTAEDRQDVLGRGRSLSSKLLTNSINPMAPALRNAISHLLFDLSDRDASKFVENVGYGFASGFLFQNNVPIPASATEPFNARDTSRIQKPVNPTTGQFLDRELAVDVPEMTPEEKEREAERLFVLFERYGLAWMPLHNRLKSDVSPRLRNTGVVDVQNPIERAVQEGRFQELDDNEVEHLS